MNTQDLIRNNAALDVLLAIVIFLAVRTLLDALAVPKPASIAVVVTLIVATVRLYSQGLDWADLGFHAPESVAFTLLLALVVYLATALAVAFVVEPFANALELPPPSFGKLGDLHGNLPYLLFMIFVIGWGAAAFGEELLFRGFLQHRLVNLFGGSTAAVVMAVLIQAILFGLGHLYLGGRGALTAGMVGLVFGTFFAATGGSLWPVIIAHGITDTLGLYALYAGLAQN